MSKIKKIKVGETEYDIGVSYTNVDNTPNIPSKTSDLTNDSGFITNSVNNLVNYYLKNEVYTKQEVAELIGAIQQFHYEVVQELPQTGETNIMYLVPKSTSQTNNVYDEYVYSNGWEKIGDTEIDLTNYVTITMLNQALADYTTTANLTTLLNAKQDVIDSTHKLDASLVDDSLSTNKFVTNIEKGLWNGKQNALYAGDNIILRNLGNQTLIAVDIQKANMPTASSETVGKIVQYTGTTDANYTNGYFYIGTSDGQEPATYSWENINVQAGGSIPSDLKVFYIEDNSSTNPFIFSEHETGAYIFKTHNTNQITTTQNVYFQATENTNAFSQNIKYNQILFYEVKFDENLQNNQRFAYMQEFSYSNFEIKTGLYNFVYMPSNDTKVGFSNNISNYELITKTTEQSITSKKTFTVLPESSVTPTTNNQLVNKKYVDDSISSAVGSINTVLATLTTPSGNGGE